MCWVRQRRAERKVHLQREKRARSRALRRVPVLALRVQMMSCSTQRISTSLAKPLSSSMPLIYASAMRGPSKLL